MTQGPLKLLARDQQDLEVLSAILQDAVVPVSGLTFKAEEKRFQACLCRFRWDEVADQAGQAEDSPDRPACYERVRCTLDIHGVGAVKIYGFDPSDEGLMLDLLALLSDPQGLSLVFAGGAKIGIQATEWEIRMQDYGESWPTRKKPSHPA